MISEIWEAPDNILNTAGVILGKEYPKPIVDLKWSRNMALDAFASIKTKDSKKVIQQIIY